MPGFDGNKGNTMKFWNTENPKSLHPSSPPRVYCRFLYPRRGQSAQANIMGLSGCTHWVFLEDTLEHAHSPTKAAAARGSSSSPALLPRRGQSAQANIMGLSGCTHWVFLEETLEHTASPTKAASATGSSSSPALLPRRGQSAQANIMGLSGCTHWVFLLSTALRLSLSP